MFGRRKKRFVFALTAGLLLLLLCGCGAEKKTDAPSFTGLKELEDRRIGVTTGSVQATQLGGLLIRIVGWVIGKLDPKNRKPEQILKGVNTHD